MQKKEVSSSFIPLQMNGMNTVLNTQINESHQTEGQQQKGNNRREANKDKARHFEFRTHRAVT